MRPYYSYAPGTPKTIAGNVTKATYEVYEGSHMHYMDEIPEHSLPYQKNNMNAWLEAIFRAEHARSLVLAWRQYQDSVEYLVNDHPVGVAKGRKRSVGTNRFTYKLGPHWKIELVITTEHYNYRYIEKIKTGEHVRQRRTFNVRPRPTLNTVTDVIKYPIQQPNGRWYLETYKNIMELQEKVPGYSLDDLDIQGHDQE